MTDPPPLPEGLRVALDPAARRIDGGRVLVGGSPLRLLRLSAAGARLVDRLAEGAPVPTHGAGARLVRRLLAAGVAHPRPTEVVPRHDPDDVAVVIPARGTRAGLVATLAALGPVGEVLVVDDGSDPPLAGLGDDVRVLRHPESRGPGAARETGWRATDRPVVAFVDAEVVPDGAWLTALLAHLADPAVAAVAPRIRAVGGTGARGAYDRARSPLDMGPDEAVVRPGSPVPYVPTALLVTRRAALEDVGGFDQGLRYGEDVDLVWRLGRRGWAIRYDPSVTASHPVRPSLATWLRQRVAYGSSAGPLAVRHGASVAPARLSGWSAAAWALVAAGHPVVGVVVAAGSTAALARKLHDLERPVQEAVRLAGRGHLLAGAMLARAVSRTWLPLAVAAGVTSRRARPAVVAAVLGPPLVEAARRRSPGDVVLRLADDAAYCAGVWAGSWRSRTWGALLPAGTGPVEPPAPVGPGGA